MLGKPPAGQGCIPPSHHLEAGPVGWEAAAHRVEDRRLKDEGVRKRVQFFCR